MGHVVAIEDNLVVVDFGRTDEPLLSKKQIAAHPTIRRSTRWIEQQVQAGMPSQLDGIKRMFLLSEVQSWLAGQGKAANG